MPINPLSASEREAGDKDKKNLISGQSILAANAPKGQSAQKNPGTPTSSGSFTNLQSYLDANKDQAGGLGAKLEGNVQKEAQGGQSELDKASQEFDSGVESAGIDRNTWNTDKLKDVVNTAYNTGQTNEDDVSALGSFRDKKTAFDAGTFQAPKFNDLNSYLSAQQKFNKAMEKAEATKSESGRETLLRDTFARPSYSKGESSLDQLFVQNDPGNRARFEGLRNNLLSGDQSITNRIQGANTRADQRYQLEGQELSDANQDLLDLLYNPRGLEGTVDLGERPNNSWTVGGLDPATDQIQLNDPSNPVILGSGPQTGLVKSGSQYGDVGVRTPVKDTGLLPDYGTRPEYGVLSYMDQLFGNAPQQALARQAAAEKTIRDSYGSKYANQNTLGVNIDKLLNAGIKKSDIPANIENLISEQELGKLMALNRLAGRNERALGDKTIGELGPRFDAGVTFEGQDAQKLINQKAAQFRSDAESNMSFLNQPFSNGKTGGEAIDDAVAEFSRRPNFMGTNAGQPVWEQRKAEADAVFNQLSPSLDKINDNRSAYGLQPLDIDAFYNGGSRNKGALEVLTDIGGEGWAKRVMADPKKFKPIVDQAVSVAKLKAVTNLLQANRRSIDNPTSKNNPTTWADLNKPVNKNPKLAPKTTTRKFVD